MAIVEDQMEIDPFSSKLFIFCNNARTIIKMVAWDGNSFILLMKRIEKGWFKWPNHLPLDAVQLNAQQVLSCG